MVAAVFLSGTWLTAAERIPPVPPRYFNDYAGTVSPAAADALNLQLEQYEKESSNQLLVAIYPKMESDSSVEDYTVRVAQAWKVGQQGKNNGAVLFVFKDDHQLYIQVGYGLEATLTDALASQIIANELKPRFRAGDFEGGLRAAVNAMIAATKGEYKGTGRTQAEGNGSNSGGLVVLLVVFCLFWALINFVRRAANRPSVLMNPRRRSIIATTPWWMGGGGGGWGGGSSGGFGGGGGFSGGGGSFGGGGAGGKW